MRRYKAVLFDLDGVIIDSMPAMRESFKNAYREVVDAAADNESLEPLFQRYCQYLGYGFREIMDRLELPHAMYEPFVRHSAQFKHRVRVNPGMLPLLQDLHTAGFKLTVATGKDGYRARDLLQLLEIAQLIDIVTGSDEVKRGKPAPDMLLMQMETLGVNADETIMVGDSQADIQAGQAAGATTIGVLWGYGTREELSIADHLIDQPAQLLELAVSEQKK
jgi:3-amino-5-hydroxybenzoic acid synthesis related protein